MKRILLAVAGYMIYRWWSDKTQPARSTWPPVRTRDPVPPRRPED